MTVTAVDTLVWAAGAVVLAAVVLLLALLAPWRSVRDEAPLPPDVETRLLLGEDPDRIASDLGAPSPAGGASPGGPATSGPETDESATDGAGDLSALAEDGGPDDGADEAPSQR